MLGDHVRLASGVRLKLKFGTIEIGERTTVRDFAVLKSSGALQIGARCTLSYGAVIHCHESVALRDGTGLAEHTSVLDSDHQLGGAHHPWHSPIVSAPVALGELTYIFASSVVLKGTRTGPGGVAAAGSVLRGDYPSASLLAGAPATVIRSLTAREIGEKIDAAPPDAGLSIPRRAAD